MLPLVASLLSAGLNILGGAVATKGKDFIQDKLGVNIENMLGTEEGKIKLLQLQNTHEEELIKLSIEQKNLDLKQEEILQKNTSDARDMQKEALKQSDVFSKRFIYYYAMAWSAISSAYIFFITFGTIPPSNLRFADTILGFILGTLIATMINFFFGSSSQSHVKDDTLANAVKGITQ